MAFGLIFAGLILFVIGSIAIAQGGAVIVRKVGGSSLTIGLGVIGLACAMPAFFVLWRAKSLGAADLAVGGVVGGAILALTFLLGLCAVARPLECPPKVMGRDCSALFMASLGFLLLAAFGVTARLAGLLLLLIFVGYLTVTFYADRRRAAAHSVLLAHVEAMEVEKLDSSASFFIVALGLIADMAGAHLTMTGSLTLVALYQWPQYAVGLSAVAVCLATPELCVVFVGARKGRSHAVVGYALLLGLFDLGVLGLFALLFAPTISPAFLFDGVVLGGICLILPLIAAVNWRISRAWGILLIVGYGLYLVLLTVRQNLLSLSLPQF